MLRIKVCIYLKNDKLRGLSVKMFKFVEGVIQSRRTLNQLIKVEYLKKCLNLDFFMERSAMYD